MIVIQRQYCSYVGFIDHILKPSFEVCGDMLELLLSQSVGGEGGKEGGRRGTGVERSRREMGEEGGHSGTREGDSRGTGVEGGATATGLRVWTAHYNENRQRWKAKLKGTLEGKASSAFFSSQTPASYNLTQAYLV